MTVVPPTPPVIPEPAVIPSGSDNRDELPSLASAKAPSDDVRTLEEGIDYAKSLRCQATCNASVAPDGDVTVTLVSETTGGAEVKSTIVQNGPTVSTLIVINDTPIAEAKQSFPSVTEALIEVKSETISVTSKIDGLDQIIDDLLTATGQASLTPEQRREAKETLAALFNIDEGLKILL